MKNILPIVLISLFSFTVISCSGEKDESTTAGSGTGDNTTGNNNDTSYDDTTTTDTTAPVLAEVTAVITPNGSSSPGYTFSTTKGGTITYGGACKASTSSTYLSEYGSMGDGVNTTIGFDNLTREEVFNLTQVGLTTTGTYDNCTITVTDSDGNVSLPLSVNKFQLYSMDYSCGGTGGYQDSEDLDFKITTGSGVSADVFIGVGDSGGVVTSRDYGATWLSLRTGITGTPINSLYNFKAVEFGKSFTHVYAGYGPDASGLIRTNTFGLYQDTPRYDKNYGDGSNYQDNVTSPGGLDIDAAYYACGTFLMAGTAGSENIILTSTDGATWDNSSRVNGAVNSIGMGNRAFIAVGDSGTTGYRSVDNGTTWTDVTLPSGGTYNGVTFGNNIFIAVAETGSSTAVVARSTDRGVSWSSIDITSVGLYGVTFGNNIFVAVGDNGKIVRSTDNGSSWTAVTSPTSLDLNAVGFAYGKSTFAAVGDNGTIVISTDNGSSWSSKSADNTSTHLRAITF
jgi:hypothetical protein